MHLAGFSNVWTLCLDIIVCIVFVVLVGFFGWLMLGGGTKSPNL